MNSEPNDQATDPSLLQRVWPWLIEIWISYVLVAFFIIRILGSGLVQRLFILLRHRLAQ